MALALAATALGASAAEGASLAVRYTGPAGKLHGDVVLKADVAASARVVAVTFLLDGRPLGSTTVAPYELDVNAGLLPAGRHRLRAVAVDTQGHRASSAAVGVRTDGKPGRILTASPTHGLRAAISALARGHVTVRLLPGRYVLTELRLGSGARLVGSGSQTVIAAPGGSYWGLLIASGHAIRVSDLALDGGGPGAGTGQAIVVQSGSSDVRLQRLTITRIRNEGVFAWGAYAGVSLQDSTLDGGGTAGSGFLAGESGHYGDSKDSSVIRTTVRGFRKWGVDFVHVAYGDRSAALHAVALDNAISDVSDDAVANGTSEGGIWSGGVEAAIVGNTIHDIGWDGIETVGSSTNDAIVDNDVRATPTGIYVEHSTNGTTIAGNRIRDVLTGINVEWRYGGIGSSENVFAGNVVTGARKTGLFIDVGSDRNMVSDNLFKSVGQPIVLQGSSGNHVTRNRACTSGDVPFVVERTGQWDDGSPAHATQNDISANANRRC